jgi:ATP-dependent helicase/nuclease subunit A
VPERPLPPLTPTGLGGPKALAGPAGQGEDVALSRGTALHLLLEHLPLVAPADRRVAARTILATDPMNPVETDTVIAEAERVLDAPHLAHLFAGGSLGEVELAAPLPDWGGRLMQGAIDRLIVTPDQVLAVDFKSNLVVPTRAEDVPQGILLQLAAYAAMLREIYPDRTIELAIVWTATATLMPIPLNIVRAAMQNATLP